MKFSVKYPTLIIGLFSTLAYTSCSRSPLINQTFIDSIQHVYTPDSLLVSNQRNMDFWFSRIQPSSTGNINEMQYAATLINRFKLVGNISDLNKADSTMRKVDTAFAHTLPGPLLALVSASIMHHRFSVADSFYLKACKLGIKDYQRNALGFDVAFETGNYNQADMYLKGLKGLHDFNYYFRLSKFDHLNGNTDSAYSAMQHALSLAGKNNYLRNLSWSMVGDLALHQEDLITAVEALKQAVRINPGDMHSLLQLAWASLMHDKDTALVGALILTAIKRNHSPDPYYKLYQTAQWQHNSPQAKYYARIFADKATNAEYETMYSKYLIELYATVLGQPQKAEDMAFAELKNRATPQTYAWYGYALLCNKKNEQAYDVFKRYIAGKPIEAIELYYSGKILKSIGHGFDAEKCFNAAMQNKYDLSPYMLEDIEKLTE